MVNHDGRSHRDEDRGGDRRSHRRGQPDERAHLTLEGAYAIDNTVRTYSVTRWWQRVRYG